MDSDSDDLLTSLDVMYEDANRRAESADWRDDYATGYSDGLCDALTRVQGSPNWQKAYEDERALCTSVVDRYRHLEGEMDGLVHMTDKIRELAEFGLDGSDLSGAAVEALIEIIRLLDGGDA